jgi:hypothetical protein
MFRNQMVVDSVPENRQHERPLEAVAPSLGRVTVT